MKGTFETQLSLMERDLQYVYVETSAVLCRDMQRKYPQFWGKSERRVKEDSLNRRAVCGAKPTANVLVRKVGLDRLNSVKITAIYHMTDGFYNIPIMWGYGNHGGGSLPVMMDRVDELKKQTVLSENR